MAPWSAKLTVGLKKGICFCRAIGTDTVTEPNSFDKGHGIFPSSVL